MGQGQLLAVGSALTLALASVAAQGPAYRERWGYTYLERLRACVLRALEGRDEATRAKVAGLFAGAGGGSPFAGPAQALALLRGVPADPAFVLRATVSAYVLPEVVDPVGANAACQNLNATVFLPFTPAEAGKLAFDVEVVDAVGAVRSAVALTERTSLGDLRMARPAAQVACGDLADGRYELVVRTLVDGAQPRPQDPALRVPFFVLRGYQARSEAALGKVAALGPQLQPLPRALLEGLAAEVSRVYLGEAFDVASDAVVDLQRLETALENLREGHHVLRGLVGDVATALPGSGGSLACVLRLERDRQPADQGKEPARTRPLCVFASGCPSYDIAASRPASPTSRGPRWIASELAAFGRGRDWDVVFLDSPGNGRNYAEDLRQALTSLRALYGLGEAPLVLVCDREAASVVGMQVGSLQPLLDGLVLVGGGGMPGPALDRLGELPVRIATLQGHPSSEGLRRALAYVESCRQQDRWRGDFASFGDAAVAWPFGLPTFAPAIADFVASIAGR
jgi:hypothetical protein